MAKKKVIAKNRTEVARIASEMDGKRKGLSRAEARKTMKHAYFLEVVAQIVGAESVLEPIIKKAKQAAKKYLATQKVAKYGME